MKSIGKFTTAVTKTQTGVIILEVNTSNPNGNIEDNLPRDFPTGHGWLTSISFKRRSIRDLLEDHESPEFKDLCKILDLDPESLHIFESKKRGFDNLSDLDAKTKAVALFAGNIQDALSRYYDSSIFGSTMLEGKSDKKSKKAKVEGEAEDGDTEAEDYKVRFVNSGAICVGNFRSVRPINIIESGIIRSSSMEDKKLAGYIDPKTKEELTVSNSTIGNGALKFVQHGVYFGYYDVIPAKARKSFATQEHVELFKRLIPFSYNFSPSMIRSDVRVIAAFHATHGNAVGTFNKNKFKNLCIPTVNKDYDPTVSSVSINEYYIPTLEYLKKEMENEKIEIEDLLANVYELSNQASEEAESVAGV